MNWRPKKLGDWPVQLSITFPKDVHNAIEKECSRLEMSKSEFVRQCVYAYLKKGGQLWNTAD